MAIGLACLHLTVALSKGQGQGHAHFECEYITNGKRYSIAIDIKMKLHKGFRSAYADLILSHSRGQSQGHVHFDYHLFSQMVRDKAHIIIEIEYYMSHVGFLLAYLELTLAYYTGHLGLWYGF